MKRLEQFLAFPLYASVAWLIWVLSLQLGSTGVATGLGGLVLIGFAAWIYGATRPAPPGRRRTATAAAALAVFVAVAGSQAGPRMWSGVTAAGAALGPSAERFTPQRLAELRARDTPVFVNFTAAWCITCLVNERIALSSPAVTDAFTRKGAAYLKADWTNRDPQITEVLASFGRSGVPLYVVYPSTRASSNEPTVLPAVLTEGLVLEAVERM
jgi:thiol:disulfide interchange protein